ncbi:TetR/AcrR family transcriptional regulator [Mycobacterium sp. CBMA247]|nr:MULTISPECIES: TetR/AcrR family transcriptional regulator [unclassified Mycolicibacterium]MUL80798.1 TetR/AcrR family transcriptional regulator [Mycolicibacterium sp. CBMA 329]MUL86565.1 TetR/AcrR family transcriptional regulator [Mycolicibacterium sp. CBMA 331]MUM01426.1 TetR/AcrR family transcriptional regulator [Mycolicibacterium sp. CBMA 334]MUM27231.1 TetR/AcrR family transcriptional regulator [Mycolicibacterium sp. CBMA 295]MUM36861.1 TetR/AcrR family transcriptional regulator [Mycolic
MNEQLDRRAELTRLQILQAAARQFARTPYSLVSLDDILADASVTKGALYFHFRSKHALAASIVEHRTQLANKVVDGVLARNLSGAETLIDLSCLVAAEDIGDPMARACLNLVESIGRTDDLGPRVLDEWVQGFAGIAKRAIGEGDFTANTDPEAVARLLVSIYLGVRQTSDLDDPPRFLTDLEHSWQLALPGFVEPERLSYLKQFIRRRTAVGIKKAAPLHPRRSDRTPDAPIGRA